MGLRFETQGERFGKALGKKLSYDIRHSAEFLSENGVNAGGVYTDEDNPSKFELLLEEGVRLTKIWGGVAIKASVQGEAGLIVAVPLSGDQALFIDEAKGRIFNFSSKDGTVNITSPNGAMAEIQDKSLQAGAEDEQGISFEVTRFSYRGNNTVNNITPQLPLA